MDKIRVLFVDDQNIVREGIVAILSFQSDIEVVGEASDGLQATQILSQIKPDVVLLDLVMPIQDGITTISQIKQLMPNVQILVLSGFAEDDLIFKAIKAGAIGYLLKDAMRDQLFQAIRDVSHGLASLHPLIALRIIREINNSPQLAPVLATASHILTPREMETLCAVGNGHSNHEIAAILVVNDHTVGKYVRSILSKLHFSNRTQVIEMLRFPVEIEMGGSRAEMKSPEMFLKYYNSIFGDEFKNRLAITFPNYLMANAGNFVGTISQLIYGGGGLAFDEYGKVIAIFNWKEEIPAATTSP